MDEKFEKLVLKALKEKTTDIHFLIDEKHVSISFRCIKGLKEIKTSEDDLKLFNYLQYLAHIDISCLSIPQSGSFFFYIKDKRYDFRFAVQQSLNQKSGVLRILNYHNGLSYEKITYQSEIIECFKKINKMRNGLVIFSGATGSGKTTTMYSLIQMMRNKKIYTIEDPIEISQKNIIQTEINNKIGYTYNEGIKQILRQNPDVIMIGEIRDEIALQGAIRASLTGCLVLCSIHSKSALGTINRLLDLGGSGYDLKECVNYIFNQRLVKKYHENEYICIFECLDNEKIKNILKGDTSYENRLDEIMREGIENEKIEDIDGRI